MTRSKYNAHTDPLFKKHNILKLSDLIQLNQTLFVRQYKNGKLPESFFGFFQDIPFNEQKSRDDDHNLKQKLLQLMLCFTFLVVKSYAAGTKITYY